MADRVGQKLGNYTLTHTLGRGGFAEVYLGKHQHLDTQAAIKILHLQLKGNNSEKFRTEARFIAQLVHPSIVRVLDFGIEDETPFLVMDYAPNGTLRHRHTSGVAVPAAQVSTYVTQVAGALQYAHEQKLVHRDIKPENMLLNAHNQVLLSDFGIAIFVNNSSAPSTQDVAGTVAYMSPEHITGKPRFASDQYSLAVVVYEWLCGERPFQGSFTELCTQQMFAKPPSLREKMPTISPAVEQVVMIALAKEPQQRFPSIQEFATALKDAISGTQTYARPNIHNTNSTQKADSTSIAPRSTNSQPYASINSDSSTYIKTPPTPGPAYGPGTTFNPNAPTYMNTPAFNSPYNSETALNSNAPTHSSTPSAFNPPTYTNTSGSRNVTPTNNPPSSYSEGPITSPENRQGWNIPPGTQSTQFPAPYSTYPQPIIPIGHTVRPAARPNFSCLIGAILVLALIVGGFVAGPRVTKWISSLGSSAVSATSTPGGVAGTSNNGGSTLGGGSTSAGALRIEPTTIAATRNANSDNCHYWGAFFKPNDGWECTINLYNDTSDQINWHATVPPGSTVVVKPTSSSFLFAGASWSPTIHIPSSASCPGQITINFIVDGGSTTPVVWNCSG